MVNVFGDQTMDRLRTGFSMLTLFFSIQAVLFLAPPDDANAKTGDAGAGLADMAASLARAVLHAITSPFAHAFEHSSALEVAAPEAHFASNENSDWVL
jgi:hypothetical protein